MSAFCITFIIRHANLFSSTPKCQNNVIRQTTDVTITFEYTSVGKVARSSNHKRCLVSSDLSIEDFAFAALQGAETENKGVLEILDKEAGALNEVASIQELRAGLWEIVILKSYRPVLKEKLQEILPNFTLNFSYKPWSDIENSFRERAKMMTEKAWPLAAAFYDHHLSQQNGRNSKRSRS